MRLELLIAFVLAGCWTGRTETMSIAPIVVHAKRTMRSQGCTARLVELQRVMDDGSAGTFGGDCVDSSIADPDFDFWQCLYDSIAGYRNAFEYAAYQAIDECTPEAIPLDPDPVP